MLSQLKADFAMASVWDLGRISWDAICDTRKASYTLLYSATVMDYTSRQLMATKILRLSQKEILSCTGIDVSGSPI